MPLLYLLPLGGFALALAATLKGVRFAASEGVGSVVMELLQRLVPRRNQAQARAGSR